MKKLQFLILPLLFCFVTLNTTAQESNQLESTISVNHSEIKPLLEYLFKKYGIEASETICLNIQDYEMRNNVIVLFEEKYTKMVSDLDNEIQQTNNSEELLKLQTKKSRLINFQTIEHLVVNN